MMLKVYGNFCTGCDQLPYHFVQLHHLIYKVQWALREREGNLILSCHELTWWDGKCGNELLKRVHSCRANMHDPFCIGVLWHKGYVGVVYRRYKRKLRSQDMGKTYHLITQS